MPSDVLEHKRNFLHWVPLYTGTIILLGIVILLVALMHLPAHRLGLLLFAGMAAIAELGSVELFISSRHSHVPVSSMIAIASILALGPFAGVLVYVTGGMMTGVKTARQGRRPGNGQITWLRRLAFNCGMLATAAAAASGVYVLLGGMPERVSQASNILPLIAAATADALANVIILIGALTLQTGRHPLHIWKQDLAWTVPICIIGGVIGGGGLAVADCLDAMCSDRPYHPTRDVREAMDTLARGSGTQFDPEVIAALLTVVEEKGPGFFKNSADSVDKTRLAKPASVNPQARYLKKSMIGA